MAEIDEKRKQICAINRETVHKICSGQVVLNLAIAVKELVENAIDAGATNIDIRLKEYGCDLVEVSDNGSGVEEKNFAALTLKHCTSKLKDFSDLESLQTLGFRGEALSSLCALSNLSITTRHNSVDYATKIDYDSNGHVIKQTKCARQVGTTVTLTDLFVSLPVRHKEFIKNLKREFTKMCNILYAYCLVTEGVRILCSNQTKKGTRTTVVATQGGKTVKENIICVFGIKQLESLVEIEMQEPDDKYLEDYGIKNAKNDLNFSLEGYISKCTHGSGRSASDRQFFYINSRPCEPNKIIKLVNEVYKYFNGAQYPFVFLNIKTLQSQIDVNVTPDKRQIFMEEERLLLATLKTTLLELFKSFPSTLRIQNLNITDKKVSTETLKSWAKSNDKFLDRGTKREAPKIKGTMSFIQEKRIKVEDDFVEDLSASSEDEDKQIDKFIEESYNSSDSEPNLSIIEPIKPIKPKINKKTTVLDTELKDSFKEFKNDFKITFEQPNMKQTKICEEEPKINEIFTSKTLPKSSIIDLDLPNLESLVQKVSLSQSENSRLTQVKFKSELTSKNAEAELERHISKEMFAKMDIIGQFNKGFIITKLDSDLFIIDQHATDEKYNFETLQKTTVIQNQKLVVPKPLELTAANELLLIDNLEVFTRNGFAFEINENAAPRFKIKLTAMPVSKNWEFGKEAIDELLFMLQEDGATESMRPSGIRSMFASRACRKSVMVGNSLSNSDMRRLVDHMGEIEQPWNCPHGRPTMRHLINLDLIKIDESSSEESD